MIICNNCKHNNLDGSMFCSECGAQLLGKDSLTTQNITTEQFAAAKEGFPKNESYQPFHDDASWGVLHLLDSGQTFSLVDKNEFTLGRVSEGQPIMPDIDLSPYQAYAAGVSRLHAVVKKDGEEIAFMDLGSANGSFLNGKRLAPNEETKLRHGDVFALGKLKMQVLVKK